MAAEIIEKDLSYAVIGVAMEIHRKLGPGLDEFYYHRAMLERFRTAGIHGRYKAKGKLTHQGEFADGFEADFLVENRIVLELKHLEGQFCPEHYAQLISYLKHWNIRLGILIDFGKESLTSQRVVYDSPAVAPDPQNVCVAQLDSEQDLALFGAICESLCSLCIQYGLGYRNTTYKSLVRIELVSRGVSVRRPNTKIEFDGLELGNTELNCLVINQQCVVRVHALQDKLRAADRAIVQTYLRHLDLRWGLLVNFGKTEFEAAFVRAQ